MFNLIFVQIKFLKKLNFTNIRKLRFVEFLVVILEIKQREENLFFQVHCYLFSFIEKKKKKKRYRAERRWSNKAGKDNSIVGLPKTATEAFKEFFSLRVSHGYLSCKLREQSNSKVVEPQSKKSKQLFIIILCT